MTLSLLVTGATGQLGATLAALDGPDLRVRALSRAELDLTDLDACAAVVAQTGADAIVNAAAYTAVDRAETEPELAARVNAEAPEAMARAAAARGLPFLQISTDYVFDGSGEAPWREDAPCAPLSVYGRTKLAGERAVSEAGGPHAVLRVSWLFSPYGSNFVKTMLRVGAERDRLTVVDDQRGGPTPVDDVAAALVAIAGAFTSGRGVSGVYHYSGAPAVTWRGFAEEIFRRSGRTRKPEVAPIATEDWPTPAMRPRNSVLDCGRILRDYGLAQPDWRAGLDRMLAALGEGRP